MIHLMKGELPSNLKPGAIERAVKEFLKEVDIYGEQVGFFNQTIGAIHAAIYQSNGDFWLAVGEDGEVDAYVLGNVMREVDNRLTYWLSQAWAHPRRRQNGWTKACWQQLRQKAKDYLCKHIVVVSGRGEEAYCRWLGKGWHHYASLLKEDI